MSLKFASLGSGSNGNATLVKSSEALLLVDCGFTLKETERRMQQLGHSPRDINAVLVTHEHGDHLKGVGPLARKYDLPVYLTPGTAFHAGAEKIAKRETININQRFTIADIEITPVAVPHDAREPCQFVLRSGEVTLGLLTDLGYVTPHVLEHYHHCQGLMVEFNHCTQMLATGPYPPSLKQRVGGQWGHLSNQQAVQLLEQLNLESLQQLVASHISDTNNCLQRVRDTLNSIELHNAEFYLADQEEGFDWLAIA